MKIVRLIIEKECRNKKWGEKMELYKKPKTGQSIDAMRCPRRPETNNVVSKVKISLHVSLFDGSTSFF